MQGYITTSNEYITLANLIYKALLLPSQTQTIFSAPIFLLSIVSNMYYLFGQEVGDMCLRRIFYSWPWGTPTVLFFMYCGSQVSIGTKNWEISKELAEMSKEKII